MSNLDANGKFVSMIKTRMRAPKHIERAAARKTERNQDRRKRPRMAKDLFLDKRLHVLRERAIRKGMDFDLDEAWLRDKLSLDRCEITGIPFDGKGLSRPFSRSIDRTDNSIGYVKSNCKVVVWIYNQAKRDHDAEHVLIMARALVERGEIPNGRAIAPPRG